MSETRYRLPNEVASQLEISPSTLRRWCTEFADYLSDAAGRPEPTPGSQVAHRRYTDQDLETLMTIKGLLDEGQSYVQVGRRLEALRLRQSMADVEPGGADQEVTALGPSLRDSSPFAPAAAVLADTIHTVADGQQLLLGSQQANREMLTVVLQDNFSLKEENAKLRDRMLDLEREISEMRRQDAARREDLEARFHKLEAQLRPSRPPAARPQQAQRSGCLGQIFG
jgi:DNA-binding transcriptional MerR regulator